jgi:hypothetical protein
VGKTADESFLSYSTPVNSWEFIPDQAAAACSNDKQYICCFSVPADLQFSQNGVFSSR